MVKKILLLAPLLVVVAIIAALVGLKDLAIISEAKEDKPANDEDLIKITGAKSAFYHQGQLKMNIEAQLLEILPKTNHASLQNATALVTKSGFELASGLIEVDAELKSVKVTAISKAYLPEWGSLITSEILIDLFENTFVLPHRFRLESEKGIIVGHGLVYNQDNNRLTISGANP